MDRVLLFAGRGARAFGFGFAAVLIGLHLEQRGLSAPLIGLALGIGLAAASISGLGAAFVAARAGRRPVLAITGVLMALTGLDLGLAQQSGWLIASGVTGMLGVASVELGPFASVEQAALTEAVTPARRNLAFARYSLTAGLFNAAGGLSAGLATSEDTTRAFFLLYAAIGIITAALPLLMSARVESELRGPAFASLRVPETRRVLVRLSALFAIDSFAGGGLINTMVFTHLPSNILLMLVALSPSLGWALGLLFARFLLSQMDVPARQAYVVSIVAPADRAAAVAVTGAVRGVAQAFGPPLAGIAIAAAAFGIPFYAGGGLKIVYDLGMF